MSSSIGLVENENADPGERDVTALDQVLEATRSGHQDVGLARLARLTVDARAAIDRGDREGTAWQTPWSSSTI